ncbi:hypothetical protein MKX66_30750 [Bacillus sp. FSL R9-9530]|uniref:hypothetical protein n=1 Tax=Bacillus TaxID=1386 RepID=UPI00077A24F1|nr:hypothetical protein [Bacillus thuringiensis]KXY54381.1 hypothetical protein AT261_23275 [Bacillus cereus]PFP53127.1 hypothetical protein COK09_26260 [Bacillus cereus]PFQ64111.1 hypothetical protein COK21_22565 [Bacillus cereus]PGK33361.1 hypothetical protein CN908_30615 [Bacillus thuringiensis]
MAYDVKPKAHEQKARRGLRKFFRVLRRTVIGVSVMAVLIYIAYKFVPSIHEFVDKVIGIFNKLVGEFGLGMTLLFTGAAFALFFLWLEQQDRRRDER